MNIKPVRPGPKIRITRPIPKPKIFEDPTLLLGRALDRPFEDKTFVYSCQYCRSKFTHNSHYHRHLMDNHRVQIKEAVFVCNDCQMIFIKKANLDRHYQVKHQIKSKSRCDSCAITFKSRYCLRRHMKLKQVLQENSCMSCQKKFTNKERLLKHVGSKHISKNVMFPCDTCGLKFKVHNSLMIHVNRMHKKL